MRLFWVAALIGAAIAGPEGRAESASTSVLRDCNGDIARFCEEVTPGGGRIVTCLLAHQDKLSGACLGAVYDGTGAWRAFVNTASILARSCDKDVAQLCLGVPAGEGRIARCLVENGSNLRPVCRDALRGLGLDP